MLRKLFLLTLLITTSPVFAEKTFLVDTDWLQKNLDNHTIRIVDMSDDTQYQRFHIPGAIHLPYSAINQRNKKGVSFSAGSSHIIKVLGYLGITAEHHVVIYDDMGGLHASRLFWELEKIGHPKISLLNGGLVKWILSGKKVTATATETKQVQYQPVAKKMRDNTATFDTITKATFDEQNILLDVRSKEEYTGHPRYPRSGHIPGAKWWEWSQAVNFESAFTLQPGSRIKQQLKQLGIRNRNTPITLYCQSGHRASHSYFTLRQLGFNKVKLYDGSMAEYTPRVSAPLNKGSRP